MHQCVHCGEMYPAGSKELLEGCSNKGCGSHFFYYLKVLPSERKGGAEAAAEAAVKSHAGTAAAAEIPQELSIMDKKQVEKDVREMIGIEDEEIPVILDLESIKISGPGKFEIDVVNLFDKKRPLIYKLDEGKYIIDLASTLKLSIDEINKKIKIGRASCRERV